MTAANAIASLLAEALLAQVPTGANGFVALLTAGLLGDADLRLTRPNGAAFSVNFQVTPVGGGTGDNGDGIVSGTPGTTCVTTTTECGVNWTLASYRFLTAGSSGSWVLGYDGKTASASSGGSIGALTAALAAGIQSSYLPLVSGSQVTFTTGWDVGPTGSPLEPSAGDAYYVAPLNPNTTVDESQQVDTLNVYDTADPNNVNGTLTENTLTGLGMGGNTVVGGVAMPGGITYSELESVNINLGNGNDTFTIASTSQASTSLVTGAGNDTVNVQTISGHTSVSTGAGDDTVTVGNAGDVSRIAGLLTVDTGTGNDTLKVDDSADPNDTTGTLTGSTLTGIGMPTVAEEQTITVAAAAGTYELLAAGYSPITLTYGESATQLETALDALFGLSDVHVDVTSSSTQTTYTVLFVGDGAGTHYPQLDWVRSWTLALTAGATALSAPGYGDASIGSTPTAAGIQAALQIVYGISAITVVAAAGGTYVVTVGGAYTALDLSKIVGATVAPLTTLKPTLDATAAVQTAIVDDGTTSPDLDTVQTIGVAATSGTYVLHFDLLNSQGELQDYATGPIQWNASAAALLAALSAILNPNNTNPALPFTDNVAVELHGSTYQITFQGEFAHQSIAYIDTSQLHGTATVSTRESGIDYYDVNTLDIDLGGGDDVFNVQGTAQGTTTNLSTGGGNDHVYVSSQANASVGNLPDHLTGVTDGILGTLAIDEGKGTNALMVSDEGAKTGSTVDLEAGGVTGLSPAPISFGATGGDLGGGITFWTGFGADNVTVNGVHSTPGVTEITTLNTGLGDDNVTANLDAAKGGFFVTDLQGAYESYQTLTQPVFYGDYNTRADVVTASLDGQPLSADEYTLIPSLNAVALTISSRPTATSGRRPSSDTHMTTTQELVYRARSCRSPTRTRRATGCRCS